MEKGLKVLNTLFLFVVSIFLQLFVFNKLSVFGVKPNMILISVIVVSAITNIYASTVYSFILGVCMDLLFGGTGMFTISYTVIGMLLGFVGEDYMKGNYISIIILSTISVVLFEIVQYFQSMINLSSYISIFFLLKQLIIGIILNVILVCLIYFIYSKITDKIDEKQNRIYW